MTQGYLIWAVLILAAVCVILLIVLISLLRTGSGMISQNQRDSAMQQDMRLADMSRAMENNTLRNEKQLEELARRMDVMTQRSEKQLEDLRVTNENKLEDLRVSNEKKLEDLRATNEKQLEDMRATVDEKLQKTLDDRISKSFAVVSDRLEQVYKGLGEMQTLASGVGDLKKVLSNVKTRGILGEIQLGAILEQILAPDQYAENVRTKSTGNERVEFAVILPGDGDGTVYLPIDAKFPADTYSALMDAYEEGDTQKISAAGTELERRIRQEAKDIREKYIETPYTTDFAIMFLPVEGLYAEVVRRGLVETLQRDYKVNIAGPTTMAALLNSLQMGFRTLAIQKHSSEVWDVLGAVKTEFDKFEGVLRKTQERLNQANHELDTLVGVRTRGIQRKLKNVQSLSSDDTRGILELDADGPAGIPEDEDEL